MGSRLRKEREIFAVVVWVFLFLFFKITSAPKRKKNVCNINAATEPIIIDKKGISSSYFNALSICLPGSHKPHYMAHRVAGNTVQFSQQRNTIPIDQCLPT